MMQESEIISYLHGNNITRSMFCDVISYEELPMYPITSPCGVYIVNTDKITGPGKHWVVILKPQEGIIEFFDSLGKNPNHYSAEIESFLYLQDSKYKYSTKRIQGNQPVCGNYCILYSYLRCGGMNMENILELFTSDLSINDSMVKF